MIVSKKLKTIALKRLINLNIDQKSIYDEMQRSNKLTICVSTGFGKGYLMICDLINQITNTDNNCFTIATHRLSLNTQHTNDIFDSLSDFLGDIGYIFVGSIKYDTSKFKNNKEYNTAILKRKMSYNDIISTTTSIKEINELVAKYKSEGKKIVIITTYHSLDKLKSIDINTLYCDESHILASEDMKAMFKKNFEKIKYNKSFFFTATPKDASDEETDAFLMNNKNIFGERIGLTFRECVDKAYIVRPIVHIAHPLDYKDGNNFNSIDNKVRFIKDCFIAHKKHIEESSVDSTKIAPKILVKCESVDIMWDLHEKLVGAIDDVIICAGASRNEKSIKNHFIDNNGISDRGEYLEKIQDLSDNQMAIVLHYDILSEGVNVPGFTGTMFLSKKLPTTPKILQNTGRSTRLHKIDRDNILKGNISVKDYSKWIKSFCSVIIPYWDAESEFSKNELAKKIKELRDNFGYDPTIRISIGDDMADGNKKDEMDSLNAKNIVNKKSDLIKEIEHEIEMLDKKDSDLKEEERLGKLSILDWFRDDS